LPRRLLLRAQPAGRERLAAPRRLAPAGAHVPAARAVRERGGARPRRSRRCLADAAADLRRRVDRDGLRLQRGGLREALEPVVGRWRLDRVRPRASVRAAGARRADGARLARSAAVLHIAACLGGLWRALALVLRAVPAPLRDLGYDAVARVRLRLFARPTEACPLLPPHLRARFDA